jgi:hypothetical protein
MYASKLQTQLTNNFKFFMGPKTHHNGEIFVVDLFVDSRFIVFLISEEKINLKK